MLYALQLNQSDAIKMMNTLEDAYPPVRTGRRVEPFLTLEIAKNASGGVNLYIEPRKPPQGQTMQSFKQAIRKLVSVRLRDTEDRSS